MAVKPDKRTGSKRSGKRSSAAAPSAREQRYRVEGLRRGRVMYVHVVGRSGAWRIFGPAGFQLNVRANKIEDVLRLTRRQLPFRPIAVRLLDEQADSIGTS